MNVYSTSYIIVVATIVCNSYVCHVMLYVLYNVSECHVYFRIPCNNLCIIYIEKK